MCITSAQSDPDTEIDDPDPEIRDPHTETTLIPFPKCLIPMPKSLIPMLQNPQLGDVEPRRCEPIGYRGRRGVNVNFLHDDRVRGRFCGMPVYNGTPCRVERAWDTDVR